MANVFGPSHIQVQIESDTSTAAKPRGAWERTKLNVLTAMKDLRDKLFEKPSQFSEIRITAAKELMNRSLECYIRKAEQVRTDLTLTIEEETLLDKNGLGRRWTGMNKQVAGGSERSQTIVEQNNWPASMARGQNSVRQFKDNGLTHHGNRQHANDEWSRSSVSFIIRKREHGQLEFLLARGSKTDTSVFISHFYSLKL